MNDPFQQRRLEHPRADSPLEPVPRASPLEPVRKSLLLEVDS